MGRRIRGPGDSLRVEIATRRLFLPPVTDESGQVIHPLCLDCDRVIEPGYLLCADCSERRQAEDMAKHGHFLACYEPDGPREELCASCRGVLEEMDQDR